MIKISKYLLALMVSVILTSTAFAGSTTNKGSNPNGKPFVEIQGVIVEIEGEIATLQDQIDSLVGRVDSIEDRLTADEAVIATLVATNVGLQAQITANADDISSLQTQVGELEAENDDLQYQINELGDADNRLQDLIDTNTAMITTLNQSITDLGMSLQDQINNNNDLIGTLEDEIIQINDSLDMKQMIVTGSCPVGQSIRIIQDDGGVVCEIDDQGTSSISQYRVYNYRYISRNYSGSVTAVCPSGYILTGGGSAHQSGVYGYERSSPYVNSGNVANSNYYGRAWYAYLSRPYYSTYLYAYAVCIRHN